MLSFLDNARAREPQQLPLFPLRTVLFPGGLLPIKIFEQRYIEMAKRCLQDEKPFGVCLLTGILFGIAPALRVSRTSAVPALKANTRTAASGGGVSSRLLSQLLVAVQVTLSLV